MKNLFFVAVAIGSFAGTLSAVKAQTSVSSARFTSNTQSSSSPRFIEGIEITPQGYVAGEVVAETAVPEVPAAVILTGTHTKTFNSVSIETCSALQFKYAQLTDMDVEAITNYSLYAFIDEWWATRYRYGGDDKKGIDCSAFTGRLLSEVFGITVPRTAREQFNVCDKISVESLLEGDLVFFNTRGGVSHVGVYLGNNTFVHSSVHGGVTISSLTDDYYSQKFIGGGRVNVEEKDSLLSAN